MPAQPNYAGTPRCENLRCAEDNGNTASMAAGTNGTRLTRLVITRLGLLATPATALALHWFQTKGAVNVILDQVLLASTAPSATAARVAQEISLPDTWLEAGDFFAVSLSASSGSVDTRDDYQILAFGYDL